MSITTMIVTTRPSRSPRAGIAAIFLIASVLDLVDFDVADRVAGDQDGQLVLLAEQEPQKAFPHGDIPNGDYAA